jgi:hypothetical protein
MTAERSRAYAHVIGLVDDLAAAKLHPEEQEAIREAADALVLSIDIIADEEARAALHRLEDVVDRMVAADRLSTELGETLIDAVERCGPQRLAA